MEQKIEIGTMDSRSIASCQTVHPYGCFLLLCTDGYARLSINRQPHTLRKGGLCVLTSEVFLSFVRVSWHFSARYLILPEATFNPVYYQISNMTLWRFLQQHPVLRLLPHQSLAFEELLNLVDWTVCHTREEVCQEVVSAMACNLFKTIDDQLADLHEKSEFVSKNSNWRISVRFFTLLYKHYKEHHNIGFYADRMNISSDYLNKAVRRIYGVAPKKFINEQLTEDIKFRLTHTGQSVKEMSQALHFEDTSYFCRFFRKQTGVSPTTFKETHP